MSSKADDLIDALDEYVKATIIAHNDTTDLGIYQRRCTLKLQCLVRDLLDEPIVCICGHTLGEHGTVNQSCGCGCRRFVFRDPVAG